MRNNWWRIAGSGEALVEANAIVRRDGDGRMFRFFSFFFFSLSQQLKHFIFFSRVFVFIIIFLLYWSLLLSLSSSSLLLFLQKCFHFFLVLTSHFWQSSPSVAFIRNVDNYLPHRIIHHSQVSLSSFMWRSTMKSQWKTHQIIIIKKKMTGQS